MLETRHHNFANLTIIISIITCIVLINLLSGSNVINAENKGTTASIWLPRGFAPAFAIPGTVFTAEIESDAELSDSGWSAVLENDLRQWNASVVSVEKGRVRYGMKNGYIFTIKVPEDISPELFTLKLTDSDGFVMSSKRSVKVEKEFEEDFYILHITDEHIAPGPPTNKNGNNSGGTASVQIKYWSNPVINLINPRLVVYTGDNTQTYYSATSWRGMEAGTKNLIEYRDSMDGCTVATAAVAGNHDVGWSDYVHRVEWGKVWEEIIGPRAFSIRMGSFYLLGSEYTLMDYFKWTRNEYNRNINDPAVTFSLIASHYYEDNDHWTTVARANNPCDLMIVGHNHFTGTVSKKHYPVYSTVSAQGYNNTGIFEFYKDGDDWVCPQIKRRNKNDVFTLWGDHGSDPKVQETYVSKNDGTAVKNTAIITNNIDKDFFNGRIRFLMKKGSYWVEGGTILSQYDYGPDHTAVVVRVNIKRLGETVVNIFENNESIIKGDVDNNGSITEDDARLILEYAAGNTKLTNDQKIAAEYNGDGFITSTDALMVLSLARS